MKKFLTGFLEFFLLLGLSTFIICDKVMALEPIEFYSNMKAVESAKLLNSGEWDTEGGSPGTATELDDDYYGVSGNFFRFKKRGGISPLSSYNVQGFSLWHLFENTQLPTNKNEKLTFTYYTDDISLTDNNEDYYMWVSSSFDRMYENYDILNDLLHGSYDQYYYGDDYTVKFATVKCDLVTDVTTTLDVYKCTSTVEFDLNKFKPVGESIDVYDYLFFGYTSNSNFSPGAIAFINELNYEQTDIEVTPTPDPEEPSTDEEQLEVSKGIFGKIGDILNLLINLPSTIVQLLIDGLLELMQTLFIPDNDYLTDWFTDIRDEFEGQLGFLSYPVTWIIQILERFLTLEDTGHYVITWSGIQVPNFDFNIIPAGSFDLATLLENDTINNMHELYFIITNALLLLAFFSLCMNTYNRVFGGDIDNYEYITVTDGYTVDETTGEVLLSNHQTKSSRRERRL